MIHFSFALSCWCWWHFIISACVIPVDDVSHSNGYKICYQLADCLRIIANQTFFFSLLLSWATGFMIEAERIGICVPTLINESLSIDVFKTRRASSYFERGWNITRSGSYNMGVHFSNWNFFHDGTREIMIFCIWIIVIICIFFLFLKNEPNFNFFFLFFNVVRFGIFFSTWRHHFPPPPIAGVYMGWLAVVFFLSCMTADVRRDRLLPIRWRQTFFGSVWGFWKKKKKNFLLLLLLVY